MPSTRDLRRRIKSVRSTRQITKAMELVATAKMRRATEATLASRPYVQRIAEVLTDLLKKANRNDEFNHPLLTKRAVKTTLIFAISSDRGLAGSYNTNLVKTALEFTKQQQAAGAEVAFITMGKKLERTLAKTNLNLVQSYPHTPTHPSTADILPIGQALQEGFLSGKYDQVMVLYTNFTSMLSQEAILAPLLPLQIQNTESITEVRDFLYEPTATQVLDIILPRLVEVELYQYLQESLASEHAARRMAMKSASDNASDMIDDLTLTYNGIRQGNITREIAEIVGGAAALES